MEVIIILYAIIGVLAGFVGGLIGIGGAIIIIPALTMFAGFSQKMAQGTSLFLLLPPIGIVAARNYYKNGNVDIKAAIVMAICFIVASYFGAKLAIYLPSDVLKKIFGIVLLFVAVLAWRKGKKNV